MNEANFLNNCFLAFANLSFPYLVPRLKVKFTLKHFDGKVYGIRETAAFDGEDLKSILNNIITAEFIKRTGKKVTKLTKEVSHKDYPFIVGDIDRVILDENAILMCRTTSNLINKHWNGDEVLKESLLQAQHNLLVTEAKKCYLAVLVGGNDLRIKEIFRDEKLIASLIKEELWFFKNHMKKCPSKKLSNKA